jgi:REP element-mobilizing transposase RayT
MVKFRSGDFAMPQPLRVLEPERLYFVTQRTFQSRFFLRPSPEINELVGGVLARALSQHRVELFSFVIMSNHFHMIVRGNVGEIPKFMGYFSGMVARRVGERIGWRGKFWHAPYDAAPILDDNALVGRLQYIFGHGIKEGLVQSARDWPGLSSLPELLDGEQRQFKWKNGTAEWEASRRKKATKPEPENYLLVLSALPCWSKLRLKTRQAHARAALQDAEKKAREGREGKAALGAAAVLIQDPWSQPVDTKRNPRPLCHATSQKTRLAFTDSWRATVGQYREASKRWRDGYFADFPQYTFKPPTACDWPMRSLAQASPIVDYAKFAGWIPPPGKRL